MRQLDILRVVGVICVIAAHVFPKDTLFPFHIGRPAIYLFFTLSGFLITLILLNSKEACGNSIRQVFRAFYARRMLRIFPIYYATILFMCALAIPGWEYWPYHLTYTSNFVIFAKGDFIGYGSHFWTLCTEEHFYLLWPFVVLLMNRRGMFWVILATLLIGPLTRLFVTSVSTNILHNVLVISLIDLLSFGALLAYMWKFFSAKTTARFAHMFFITGLIASVTMLLLESLGTYSQLRATIQPFGLGLLYFGTIHYLARGLPGKFGKFLGSNPICLYGKMTYCIYVVHNPIKYLLIKNNLYPESYALAFLALMSISSVVALLSWHFLESPINELKRWFPYIDGAKKPKVMPEVEDLKKARLSYQKTLQ